ncbi:MAG: flagellar basal-body MS-ring/collar protein FliF [Rhodospirillales bacterium]
MGSLLEFLKNLGTVRLAIMGIVFLALALFFIFMTTRLTGTSMELLFSNLDSKDSNQVIAQLQQQNIPYDVKDNGKQIFVPSDKVGSTRIALAQEGLPGSGTVGYEIFDKASALGTTNFMQNISLVRALEGELARTIRSLKAVHSARVHLVLPKRQLFSRTKQSATASVILKMRGSQKLAGERIAAIQHLVASSVPELDPARIAIVDDKGNLLARGDDTDSDAARANNLIERKIAIEARLARELTELLTKSVGPGKVHVRIDADLDFDRITTTEETFNPDGQVVRSTRTIDENQSSTESESSAVTVQTNLPDAGQDSQNGPKASTSDAKTDEQVNFEISKKITNFSREVGTIRRLSVAVLVDGTMVDNGKGDKEYKARPAAEMDKLSKLVSSAIGFNKERGDTVEVINMKFSNQRLDVEESFDLFLGLQKSDLLRIAEVIVLSILALLVILLVVRPIISKAFEAQAASVASAEQQLLEQASHAATAISGPAGVPPDGMEELEGLIDIDRVEDRVKSASAQKVEDIINKHPEEALSILRSWIYAEA